MSPDKTIFPAEANVSAENFIKDVLTNWAPDIFKDAERLEMNTDSVTSRIRMQLRLRAPTDDPDELLQDVLKIYGEQNSLPDLQA